MNVLESGLVNDIDGGTGDGVGVRVDVGDEGFEPALSGLAVGIQEGQGAPGGRPSPRQTCPYQAGTLSQVDNLDTTTTARHLLRVGVQWRLEVSWGTTKLKQNYLVNN